jgi:chaperonin GroEL (HSP60 family)
MGGEDTTFVTKCKNPKAVSVILRGSTEHVVNNVETAFEDATRVVGVVIEDGKLVAGGGSPEVELALRLKEYAATLKGREQLAVTAFAEALEVIPRTLAENGGLDPIDKLVELRSQHEKGVKTAGLNVITGEVTDMWEEGVVEPLRVKTQALNSATESATMILRIDDVIASSATGGMGEGMPPGGMPGGMPDMDFDM